MANSRKNLQSIWNCASRVAIRLWLAMFKLCDGFESDSTQDLQCGKIEEFFQFSDIGPQNVAIKKKVPIHMESSSLKHGWAAIA
ncbi:hypothetical protein NPIL_443611 [Nephila pilipes]|uniref:Uncharacterized protein n=1 Tax=Nephila pilipes TaxID=299642 RepID=A0A8X6U8V3_NEPPI|nr:hypothetical protein NPIL_443611 [Nephila pilipes]